MAKARAPARAARERFRQRLRGARPITLAYIERLLRCAFWAGDWFAVCTALITRGAAGAPADGPRSSFCGKRVLRGGVGGRRDVTPGSAKISGPTSPCRRAAPISSRPRTNQSGL